MKDKHTSEADLFLDMLLAAMEDAVSTGHITQLQTTITAPKVGRAKLVRLIVVPEEMQVVRPVGGKFTVPE